MVTLGLEILLIVLNESPTTLQKECKERALEIRENPPHFQPKGGFCMVGAILILFFEIIFLFFPEIVSAFI